MSSPSSAAPPILWKYDNVNNITWLDPRFTSQIIISWKINTERYFLPRLPFDSFTSLSFVWLIYLSSIPANQYNCGNHQQHQASSRASSDDSNIDVEGGNRRVGRGQGLVKLAGTAGACSSSYWWVHVVVVAIMHPPVSSSTTLCSICDNLDKIKFRFKCILDLTLSK
jgi:hypothetical protein